MKTQSANAEAQNSANSPEDRVAVATAGSCRAVDVLALGTHAVGRVGGSEGGLGTAGHTLANLGVKRRLGRATSEREGQRCSWKVRRCPSIDAERRYNEQRAWEGRGVLPKLTRSEQSSNWCKSKRPWGIQDRQFPSSRSRSSPGKSRHKMSQAVASVRLGYSPRKVSDSRED